jgi:integrase
MKGIDCMATWEKRGDNSYRLIAYCGYDSSGKKKTPKRKTIKITEKMTEKQLIKFLDKEAILFQQEVDNGLFLDASKMSFEEFSQRWIVDYGEKQLQPKTIARYKDFLLRINQAIGHIKLDKLQPHHLNEFYNNLGEAGVRLDGKYTLNNKYIELIEPNKKTVATDAVINTRTLQNLLKGNPTSYPIAEKLSKSFGVPVHKMFNSIEIKKGLNPKTILHHHRLISAILNKAIKWQIILSNPSTRVELPKVKPTEATFYDDEQIMQLFRSLIDEPLKYQCAIYIALYGGLRLGEVTGLEWSDIDFEEKSLSITKARQYISGLGTYDIEPKTERSVREIQLSDGVLNILKEYKNEQEAESQRIGDKWVDSGKIFTQWNGLPMFPSTPSQWFNKWLKRTDLPKVTFHQLRHSHASILIANGVDIATVSKRLGHAKILTTINTYTHAIKSKDTAAADLLDDIIKLDRGSDMDGGRE